MMRANPNSSEWTAVQLVLDSANINDWNADTTTAIRNQVRQLHLAEQDERCCYCRVDLRRAHGLAIDPEHILPEAHFPQLRAKLMNLSVSCKRCNMSIKRADYSFVVDEGAVRKTPWDGALYRIIHPNIDAYNDHIRPFFVYAGTFDLVWYRCVPGSAKGPATKSYFRLQELQRDWIDRAQGRRIGKRARASLAAVVQRFTEKLK